MSTNTANVRVIIVEDDAAIREGLKMLIDSSGDCTCVAAFDSGEAALEAMARVPGDVLLMDINLPGMSGIECIRQWRRCLPCTEIMMLTVFEDHQRIFESLAAGASGYLLKQTPPQALLEAIRELHRGGSPMSSQIARQVVQAFRQAPVSGASAEGLTTRENEILALLGKGNLYKEIADQLGVSFETVRTHIHNIYSKLHVRSRTEAVMKVFGRIPQH